jgi:hypothetical protein
MRTRGTAAVLCVLLAGCARGAKAPEAVPTTPLPAGTSAAPTTPPPPRAATPTRRPSPSLATDLPDGTHYAFLKSLDLATRTVVVDVVQFLTGDAARQAATDDGQEADNDYYVRNVNTKLRTLAYVPSPPVIVNTLTADETGDATKDTTITVERFDGYFAMGEAQPRLYWFTLSGGVVTKIHEQYLP